MLQNGREALQILVSGLMAAGIVNPLKIIDIYQEHDAELIFAHPFQSLCHQLFSGFHVVEIHQRIPHGFFSQLLLLPYQLIDLPQILQQRAGFGIAPFLFRLPAVSALIFLQKPLADCHILKHTGAAALLQRIYINQIMPFPLRIIIAYDMIFAVKRRFITAL